MRRMNGPLAVFAILLAALLPLEQGHCLLMPLQARAAQCGPPSPGATNHSCCESSPGRAAQPRHDTAPAGCPCIELPSGTVPQDVVVTPRQISGLILLAWTCFLAVPQAATAPAPAPDVGSAPLPIACDAHGLRAPPLSA